MVANCLMRRLRGDTRGAFFLLNGTDSGYLMVREIWIATSPTHLWNVRGTNRQPTTVEELFWHL